MLGVINAVRARRWRQRLSGVVASIVVVLAQQITSATRKYFDGRARVTISTTLISLPAHLPGLVEAAPQPPGHPRPFKMPAYRPLTVLLQ